MADQAGLPGVDQADREDQDQAADQVDHPVEDQVVDREPKLVRSLTQKS